MPSVNRGYRIFRFGEGDRRLVVDADATACKLLNAKGLDCDARGIEVHAHDLELAGQYAAVWKIVLDSPANRVAMIGP